MFKCDILLLVSIHHGSRPRAKDVVDEDSIKASVSGAKRREDESKYVHRMGL